MSSLNYLHSTIAFFWSRMHTTYALYIQYLTELSTPLTFFFYILLYFIHLTTLKKLHFATM